jgi:hypothetical protein
MAFPKSFAKAFYGSPKLTPIALHELVPFLVLPKTANRKPQTVPKARPGSKAGGP